MPLYYVQQVGPNLVMLAPIGGGHPDQGLPGAGGVDPGYGQPVFGRPDQGLPGGGHISNRPPGSGGGGIPDNELPDTPPPQVAPGATLVLIRGPQGKWVYAAIDPGSPPPKPLPSPPHPGNRPPGSGGGERPDKGLPGNQPGMDQGLPGQRPPHASGQPVPPQPTPQRR